MKTKTKSFTNEVANLSKIDSLEFDNKLTIHTSLRGYVSTSYDLLLLTFGSPTFRGVIGDGKVKVEWVLRVGSTIATIYDYKDDCSHDDRECDWHIGGFKNNAVKLVASLTGFRTKENL